MKYKELFKAKNNKKMIEMNIKEINIIENNNEILWKNNNKIDNIIEKRIENNITENNAKILKSESMEMIANALLTLKKIYNNDNTRFKFIEQEKAIQLMMKKEKDSLIILSIEREKSFIFILFAFIEKKQMMVVIVSFVELMKNIKK